MKSDAGEKNGEAFRRYAYQHQKPKDGGCPAKKAQHQEKFVGENPIDEEKIDDQEEDLEGKNNDEDDGRDNNEIKDGYYKDGYYYEQDPEVYQMAGELTITQQKLVAQEDISSQMEKTLAQLQARFEAHEEIS
uniref:Uncharacterized protein n=1 Tax=Cannabis sativa TaxID=3483 RepID=A0A803P200_CANSA